MYVWVREREKDKFKKKLRKKSKKCNTSRWMFVVAEAYKMYQASLKIPSTTSHTHTPQSFPTRPTEPFAELAQRATITDAHAQCLLHWVAPKCRLHSLDFRLGCSHDECCSRSASKRSSEYFKTNRCRVNDGTTEQNSKYIPSFFVLFLFSSRENSVAVGQRHTSLSRSDSHGWMYTCHSFLYTFLVRFEPACITFMLGLLQENV